jgi:hypothetical protein
MRTPEERRHQHWHMLLRYTVLQCHAKAGVLLKPEPDGSLRTLAATEAWSPADMAAAEALWIESRGAWLAGQARRRGRVAARPLAGDGRRVTAFVVLSGVAPDFTPAPAQRDILDRLAVEANARIPRDPLRALLLAWFASRPRPQIAFAAAGRAA